ncbi:MAG: quinoprotein relay system zinc metallohydrolase 2 [Steroidobacteraceae bacterium]
MRLLCALLAGGALAAPLAGLQMSPARAADAFNLAELKPGVYVHAGRQLALDAPGHDDIANIGFIVGTRCVAVIDTGGSVRIGRSLRAAIAGRTALPVCYVINTHVHVDHVLGNAAFTSDGPSFVGHARLADAMRRSAQFFMAQYADDFDAPPTPQQLISPDRRVERETVLDLGHRRILLRAWPTAHSDCDLTVFDEQTGTLWTGDLLVRERLPAVDGSVSGWLAAIDDLAALRVKLAIPGHGPATGRLAAALIPERDYLQTLVTGVRAELSQGEPMQHAMAHVASPAKSGWLLWEGVHERNVARVYQELEWQ